MTERNAPFAGRVIFRIAGTDCVTSRLKPLPQVLIKPAAAAEAAPTSADQARCCG